MALLQRIRAVHVFSLVAIGVGALVSYYPPNHNAEAIWALASGFLGYAIRDLFDHRAEGQPQPNIAVNTAQSGFASISLVLALAVLSLTALTGCSTLQHAGNAQYSVTPFDTGEKTAEGKPILRCCKVDVNNGKEIANLDLHVTKTGEDYVVDLKEQGVLAFQGQAIAAQALQSAVDAAVKAALATALAPILPQLAPAAGAALASPGIGAAAVGAGVAIGAERLAPATPAPLPAK